VIKILFKYLSTQWKDFDYNKQVEEKHISNHIKYLTQWIEELVDKGNWTIIAATTEYIILQKRDYAPKSLKMPNVTKSLIKGDVTEAPTSEEGEEEEPETPQ